MDLDELRKMKDTVQDAAREVEQSIHSGVNDLQQQLSDAQSAISTPLAEPPLAYPEYKHPRKNWRLKQGATPQWYKARNGVRTKALSGAARVMRYRPKKLG
jgi:sec-independent protein translocase protein TatB